MPESTVQSLLARYQAEHERLVARAAKLKAAIAGLQAALELEGVNAPADQAAPPQSVDSTRSRGALVGSIRAAFDHMPEQFTINEVVEHMRKDEPDLDTEDRKAAVSRALSRFVKQKVLDVVSPGAGRRPTIYRAHANGFALAQ